MLQPSHSGMQGWQAKPFPVTDSGQWMTLQAFTEQSLDFQQKIIDRSGLGDETYLPDGGPRISPASPLASPAFTIGTHAALACAMVCAGTRRWAGQGAKYAVVRSFGQGLCQHCTVLSGGTRSCENTWLCAARDRGVVPRWLRCG